MDERAPQPVRVWDLPVRLFHWLLLALMTVSVVTGLYGGNTMVWHMRSGYAILALVAFRLIWGVVGSTTARFSVSQKAAHSLPPVKAPATATRLPREKLCSREII